MIIPKWKFGTMVNGTQYLNIFGVTILPCTIAVPLYIISFVGYITNDKKQKINVFDCEINIEALKIILTSVISLMLSLIIPSFGNTIILVIVIVLISSKIVWNAKCVKDQYGKFLIIGLGCLFIFQSFASMLMNVNLGIKAAINIPFVNYGGLLLMPVVWLLFFQYIEKKIILTKI